MAAKNVDLRTSDLTLSLFDYASIPQDTDSGPVVLLFWIGVVIVTLICWLVMWPICRNLANSERRNFEFDHVFNLIQHLLGKQKG